ncbi:MAG: glycine/betaine ABC transporter permease [Gammaproteobacteria bacterium]|nr:MAG: glycine/betaine ABC transporter permease [Gammaproteobacteria bacterium]
MVSAILDPFQKLSIPFDTMIDALLEWIVLHFRDFFQVIRWPVDQILGGIEAGFLATPPLIFLIIALLLCWQLKRVTTGILVVACFIFIGLIGAWDYAMTTLSVVLTSVFFCALIGVPTGILAARFDRFATVIRPILDVMQATPAFVYLVPVVMLFGVGKVPGTIVTIIFATAPLARLTNLGIRNVSQSVIEAALAFGASPSQLLFKVQIPLARWSIMAGLTQTVMLSISMSVIAAMIAVGGLGQLVLQGIGRLEMGLAAVGGVGIVLVAVSIDRMTQALGTPRDQKQIIPWFERGPAGLSVKLYRSIWRDSRETNKAQ